VDRNTLETLFRESAKQLSELPRASHRVDATDGRAGERLEQRPATRAHREPSAVEVRLEQAQDVRGQSWPRPLQVEDELRLVGRRLQQSRELELRSPPGANLPAIPEKRKRPGRLEVPDFEPAPMQAYVSLYKGRSEAFRRPQVAEPVPPAVGDEERPPERDGHVRPE
jgi:hypothetical protein